MSTRFRQIIFLREVDSIRYKLRELRNDDNKLLCKANDANGTVETEGPHKSLYTFKIPVGNMFTVVRGKTTSYVTRTSAKFVVENQRNES